MKPRDRFSNNENAHDPWDWAFFARCYNFILTNDKLLGDEQQLFFCGEPCIFIPESTSLNFIKTELNNKALWEEHANWLGEFEIQQLEEIPQGFSSWKCDGIEINFFRP